MFNDKNGFKSFHPNLDYDHFSEAVEIHLKQQDRFDELDFLDKGVCGLMFAKIYTEVYLDTPQILDDKPPRS